jgi:hypothetical protein
MSLTVDLIKTPGEISLSGNPLLFTFALAPYSSIERSQDIRLTVRVEVEDFFGSNIYKEKRSQPYYPDNQGLIQIDISSIIDPYLEYYLPRLTLAGPVQAADQRKRFRVIYVLERDNIVISGPTTSTAFYAIKGGTSYETDFPHLFFDQHVVANKKPLLFSVDEEKTGIEEIRFLFWVYPSEDLDTQSVKFVVNLSDGSTVDKTLSSTAISGKWAVLCAPCGFKQCGLDDLVPDGLLPVKYTVEVFNGSGTIVAPVTLVIDHRAIYEPSYIMYRNSLGGLTSLRLRGQVDMLADYDRQLAISTVLPSSFQNLNLVAQNVNAHTEETKSFKGDTGFISRALIDTLADMMLTPQLFTVENRKFIPAVLNGKNTKFYSLRDTLFSLQFEWQYAFVNQYYTQKGLISLPALCPAMENMVVKQRNKNTVQIMYSLPMPYDLVEFQIDNGTDIITWRAKGNAGNILKNFVNPAAGADVDITVRGRLVCDPDSDPADFGPYTTLVLSVTGNSLPIAIDDVFNIASGYNAPVTLSGTALANDYDPDGDPIEAIANAGATTQGGTFAIDVAGVVTYTPPNSSFSGEDKFTYEIREVGGAATVQATVRIFVGAAPVGTFAKITQRNMVFYQGMFDNSSEGEYWMEFFQDTACTQPLDVTSKNLTVNYKMTDQTTERDGTNYFVDDLRTLNPTGTAVKLYEGQTQSFSYDVFLGPNPLDKVKTFHVLPGAGYIAL